MHADHPRRITCTSVIQADMSEERCQPYLRPHARSPTWLCSSHDQNAFRGGLGREMWKHCRIRRACQSSICKLSRLLGVLVEPLADLLAHPSSVDHPREQAGRTVLAISPLGMQNLLNGQAGIQTDQVCQPQGTHRMSHTQTESCIDVLCSRRALQMRDELIACRREEM